MDRQLQVEVGSCGQIFGFPTCLQPIPPPPTNVLPLCHVPLFTRSKAQTRRGSTSQNSR